MKNEQKIEIMREKMLKIMVPSRYKDMPSAINVLNRLDGCIREEAPLIAKGIKNNNSTDSIKATLRGIPALQEYVDTMREKCKQELTNNDHHTLKALADQNLKIQMPTPDTKQQKMVR